MGRTKARGVPAAKTVTFPKVPGDKPTGKLRRFHVVVTKSVDLFLDTSVITQGTMPDDPIFGGRADSDMVAQHVAFNMVCNDLRLSQIDGYANCPDESAKVQVTCD